MTEALLHCPFCGFGNSMVEAYQDDYGYWKVGCGRCGSHSGALHPNHKTDAKERIISLWNSRPDAANLETIVAAAVRYMPPKTDPKRPDYGPITISVPQPGRHGECLHPLSQMHDTAALEAEQGFLTSTGRFVDRREAKQIAIAAGQELKSDRGDQLYSEDLW